MARRSKNREEVSITRCGVIGGVTMEGQAPKRRGFRWSLRTMLAVVTVLAVLLGVRRYWRADWVKQRHEFLSRHEVLARQYAGRLIAPHKAMGRPLTWKEHC